jgi:hypothetical protein
MPDVEARISLVTTGGDSSAAEIKKAGDAIGGVTSASNNLQTKFQERFQHIGLHLFAGQAMQTIGLSGETRQAVMLMNTALTGMEAAAGITSGGMILLVTALVAVAGATYKAMQHHKDEAAELSKLADQQSKNLSNYTQEIGYLEKIQAATGHLTPVMRDLLNADKAVADDLKNSLMATQMKEIAALDAQREKIITHAALLHMWGDAMKQVKAIVLDAVNAALWPLTKIFSPLNNSLKAFVGHITNMVSPLNTNIKLTGDLKQKYDDLTAQIDRLKLQHQLMTQGSTTDLQTLSDAAQKAADQERQRMDNHVMQYIKTQQEMTKTQEKELKERQKKAEEVGKVMGKDFADMANSMIFDSKNIGQAFQSMIQKMVQQFITHVIEMIFEWLALKAIMSIWPGGAAAYVGTANAAYPALAQATYAQTAGSAGHAIGGSVFADQPTMAMFGEGGPEIATFTPMTGGGAKRLNGGGSGGVSFGDINITVSGVKDPDQIARTIGQKIIQQIRGQGQINFQR